jgi:hypothetical protein
VERNREVITIRQFGCQFQKIGGFGKAMKKFNWNKKQGMKWLKLGKKTVARDSLFESWIVTVKCWIGIQSGKTNGPAPVWQTDSETVRQTNKQTNKQTITKKKKRKKGKKMINLSI